MSVVKSFVNISRKTYKVEIVPMLVIFTINECSDEISSI